MVQLHFAILLTIAVSELCVALFLYVFKFLTTLFGLFRKNKYILSVMHFLEMCYVLKSCKIILYLILKPLFFPVHLDTTKINSHN